MSRVYTEDEAKALAVAAAREAVAQIMELAPERSVPTLVTRQEAAKMLGVSVRTVDRMGFARSASGRLSFAQVARAAAAK